jgi:hypothetical protein
MARLVRWGLKGRVGLQQGARKPRQEYDLAREHGCGRIGTCLAKQGAILELAQKQEMGQTSFLSSVDERVLRQQGLDSYQSTGQYAYAEEESTYQFNATILTQAIL